MPIVRLENARNVTELAQGLFGLAADDPRVAAAVRALAAANPRLPADLGAAPPETRIIVPSIAGLPVPPAANAPHQIGMLSIVGLVNEAAKRIAAAAASEPSTNRDAERLNALTRLATSLPLPNSVQPAPKSDVDPTKLSAQLQQLAEQVEALMKQRGGA